jgi:magnesium transporter
VEERAREAKDHADDGELVGVIGDCGLYRDGRRLPGRLDLAQATQAARSGVRGQGYVWIGLQQAGVAEVAEVARRFRLPALAVEDAVKAHQRPKLERYGDILFMILKPVRYVDHQEVVDISQLAVFVAPSFVVTVRHGDSDVLARVRAELDSADGVGDRAPDGDGERGWHGPMHVLYRAADLVVDGYEEALDAINEDIDEVETQVFAPGGADHSERIYKLKREIAEFRRAVVPLGGPLQRLASGNLPHGGGPAGPHFRDVLDHVTRASEAIEAHDRLLSDVLQANLARVGTLQNQIALRQNEDMRRISAWAAIALVPTAVAGLNGMNFDYMPELRWRYGYFAVVAVIATVCVVLYRLFRRNGWL